MKFNGLLSCKKKYVLFRGFIIKWYQQNPQKLGQSSYMNSKVFFLQVDFYETQSLTYFHIFVNLLFQSLYNPINL